MSLNAFMHSRNIYRTPPDFKALVADYPDIRKYMTTDIAGKTRYDFKDPDALRVLTQTLLKKDFQLDVEIPADKLVPTLPNRLNYILWLEDIVRALKLPKEETVTGLDIGTGACAVYPLLGSRRGWRMVGTERDQDSLAVAKRNVERNQLQDRVQVLEADSTLLTGPLQSAGPVHFTLCNPPFFDSESEAESEARARRPPPPAAATGLMHEVSCPGGERAFVSRMIAESAALTDRCRVFTTMLGHKSSVRPLKKVAYEAGAKEAITTELCQGNTKRWAIGWTFRDGLDLAQNVKAMKQTKKRTPVQCVVPRDMNGIQYSVPDVKQHVTDWLQELKLEVEPGKCNKYFASYKVTAWEDTWTHRRLRRRAEERAATATSDLEPSPGSAELAASPEPEPEPELVDTSAISDTSDLSCHTDGSEMAAAKRTRADSGDATEDGDSPASKRQCLESQLGAVSLAEQRRRPALVFTLFVQRKGADILLLLTLVVGALGAEGVNGVLLFLKNKLRQRIAVTTTSAGAGGAAGQGAAATAPVSGTAVTEGMGRVFKHLRNQMRQKISLPGKQSAAAAGDANPAAKGEPAAGGGKVAETANP